MDISFAQAFVYIVGLIASAIIGRYIEFLIPNKETGMKILSNVIAFFMKYLLPFFLIIFSLSRNDTNKLMILEVSLSTSIIFMNIIFDVISKFFAMYIELITDRINTNQQELLKHSKLIYKLEASLDIIEETKKDLSVIVKKAR